MRYSDGSIKLLHDNVWQARYVYTVEADDGQILKKAVARNFRAESHVEALKEREIESASSLSAKPCSRSSPTATMGCRSWWWKTAWAPSMSW